eukprot:COSAG06_NODE_344_length_17074_cov_116.626510_14_plen_93_part_00
MPSSGSETVSSGYVSAHRLCFLPLPRCTFTVITQVHQGQSNTDRVILTLILIMPLGAPYFTAPCHTKSLSVTRRQAAQALNEKLFNEMHSVT